MSNFKPNSTLVVLTKTGKLNPGTEVTFVRDSGAPGNVVVKGPGIGEWDRFSATDFVQHGTKLTVTQPIQGFKVGDVVTFDRWSRVKDYGLKLVENENGGRNDRYPPTSFSTTVAKAQPKPAAFVKGQQVRLANPEHGVVTDKTVLFVRNSANPGRAVLETVDHIALIGRFSLDNLRPVEAKPEAAKPEATKPAAPARKFKDGQQVRDTMTGLTVTIERYSRAANARNEVKLTGDGFDRFPEARFETLPAATATLPQPAPATKGLDLTTLKPGTELVVVTPAAGLLAGSVVTFSRRSVTKPEQIYVSGSYTRIPASNFALRTDAPALAKPVALTTAEKLAVEIEKMMKAGTKTMLINSTADGLTVQAVTLPTATIRA